MARQRTTAAPTLHTAFAATLIALVAGTVAPVAAAQESKERPASRDPKVTPGRTVATVQPSKDGKAAPASTPRPSPSAGQTPPPRAGEEGPQAVPVDDGSPPPPEGWYRFPAFSEPVDVKLLVDLVAERMKIQIVSTDTALRDKKIQLYTPVDLPEEKLLDFLGLLLEQNGQFIRRDPLGFYVIEPTTAAGSNAPSGELSTTQVVPTKGLKPTSLVQAIAQVLRGGPNATGQQGGGPQGLASTPNIAYLDDLGVLVMTDTPRRITAVRGLIDELAGEQINLEFTRFEVRHLSAAIARQRMLELLGQASRSTGFAGNLNQNEGNNQLNNAALMAAGAGGNSSNLAVRLSPDPQSNALLLRGRPEEVDLIERLLKVVDVPNQLIPKWYAVGPAAQALAEQGKRAGLGEVTVMQTTTGRSGNTQNPNTGGFFRPDENGFPINNAGQFGNNQNATGPVFVLDSEQRGFIYYGTAEQHTQLDKLVKEFGELTQSERVVYEFYKLKFVDAEKTADVIRGLINNSVPGGESPLLPGSGGSSASRRNSRGASLNASAVTAEAGGVGEIVATDDVHVLPDKSNNQVVVKAPQRLQPQFQRLIEKIDLRRPQVYIDAKIIVVSDREDFQLTVETQLVNAGGSGGALQTLFPGTRTNNTNIITPPTVAPPSASLGGITAAIIKSEYVPIIINAVAQNRSGRIVASPQLLVDDNEEAEISSLNEEPTTTTTLGTGNNNNTTSFGGYEEAGPQLRVKPRLSTGDLLSMEYEVELSSFTGSSTNGVPPPRLVNKIKSDSITLPSDSTIIVGGLEFTNRSNNIIKVPLLGDIPIVGEAFKSTGKVDDKRTVYVFITPKIMRDPLGNDLRYFSQGPAKAAELDPDLPPVKIELIEIHGAPAAPKAPAPTGSTPATTTGPTPSAPKAGEAPVN